jgi:hypothetical protein
MKTLCTLLLIVLCLGCKKPPIDEPAVVPEVDTTDLGNYIVLDSHTYYRRTVKGSMKCEWQYGKPSTFKALFAQWWNNSPSMVYSVTFIDSGSNQNMCIYIRRNGSLIAYSNRAELQGLYQYIGPNFQTWTYTNLKFYLGAKQPYDSSKYIVVSGKTTSR